MTTPPADPAAGPPAGGEPGRIESLAEQNARLDRIEQALARVVPTSHAQAQEHTEHRLDRPTSVAEEVAAALRQERASQARKAEAEAGKQAAAAMDERVKKLEAERRPAEEPSRLHKVMGWAR